MGPAQHTSQAPLSRLPSAIGALPSVTHRSADYLAIAVQRHHPASLPRRLARLPAAAMRSGGCLAALAALLLLGVACALEGQVQ